MTCGVHWHSFSSPPISVSRRRRLMSLARKTLYMQSGVCGPIAHRQGDADGALLTGQVHQLAEQLVDFILVEAILRETDEGGVAVPLEVDQSVAF
jgi:hypothetical protein